MPSLKMNYVAGSGFLPLISGNPYSGQLVPVGGIQLVTPNFNSGNIYVSLSGAFHFTGIPNAPLAVSGGPTINSGGMTDAIPIAPGASYFIPKQAIPIGGAYSGTFRVSVGCDVAGSGRDFVYWEVL